MNEMVIVNLTTVNKADEETITESEEIIANADGGRFSPPRRNVVLAKARMHPFW